MSRSLSIVALCLIYVLFAISLSIVLPTATSNKISFALAYSIPLSFFISDSDFVLDVDFIESSLYILSAIQTSVSFWILVAVSFTVATPIFDCAFDCDLDRDFVCGYVFYIMYVFHFRL